MRLYLIRHGETDWNIVKRLQGSTDIPLNNNGETLAKITGEKLNDFSIDLIYTSPLKRAFRTAELIRGTKNIPMITDERIREISFGDYEGLISKADGYNIPDPNFRFFFTRPDCYRTPPNGESIQSLLNRTHEFLEDLKNNPSLNDQTILISSHGAAVQAILSNIKNSDLSHFWGDGVHKNCGVSCIDLIDGHYKILWENKVFYEVINFAV